MEHNDYHYASDLARESNVPLLSATTGRPASGSSRQGNKAFSPSRPMRGKKRKGPEPEGIAKFFIKKAKT